MLPPLKLINFTFNICVKKQKIKPEALTQHIVALRGWVMPNPF